ncbi:hypothetical protein [Kitasatospora sp. NPDC101183]|uniref:hypothetical protein n=1 Tax=Kitasatospora sp. NPDC101183 TaxID=3364100 RepID=UPI003820550E
MSESLGRAISGYLDGPFVAGEPLLVRGGFWTNHLAAVCRVDPEWFGEDGGDADAILDELMGPDAWPTLRVPFGGGHAVLIVYRNLDGDSGLDYLLTHPGWARAEILASIDGDRHGPGLDWRRLVRIADTPDPAAPGVHAPAERLLLLLPALVGEEASAERLAEALAAIGAPAGDTEATAEWLLRGRFGVEGVLDATAESPLSGGGDERGGRLDPFWRLNLTAAQYGALVAELG